jgi:prephenate dehydrogenase
MNVGIVGLGLIGGSMAKSIQARTSHTVWGLDRDTEPLHLAKITGAIDGELTEETLPRCDLILLALRPQAAVAWAAAHADGISPSAVVVDCCGVKRTVTEPMAALAAQHGFAYIGGHPMAGKEYGGFANSSAHLFDGAAMILTPDSRTDLPMLEMLKAFFLEIGFARLTFTSPEEHDRIIAYTSQLAHITSSAYVKSSDALRCGGFSAGSFQDMTRVAHLDEEMWTELFLDNADYLTGQLEELTGHLSEYLSALRQRDAETLRSLLKEGRERKSASGL